MGARLMSLVLVRWSFVSDEAFRVLSRMAVTALDESSPNSPAGLYFAGRELLVMSLKQGNNSRTTLYRRVSRAIAELEECGAIERTKKAYAGQNAVYAMRLDSTPKVNGQGGPSSHAKGGSPDHPMDGLSDPNSMAHPTTPRNHEEPVEDQEGEEPGVDLRTAVTVVEPSEPEKSPKESGCERGCSRGYLLVGEMIERCPCNNVIPFPAVITEEAS